MQFQINYVAARRFRRIRITKVLNKNRDIELGSVTAAMASSSENRPPVKFPSPLTSSLA